MESLISNFVQGGCEWLNLPSGRFTPTKEPIHTEWKTGWTPETVGTFGQNKSLLPLLGVNKSYVAANYAGSHSNL